MGDRRGGGGGRKVLLPPINFIFKLLQQHSTVSIWLYEQLGIRIEGKIRGFDEFMNLVIDDAVEVQQPGKDGVEPEDGRRELGKCETGPAGGGAESGRPGKRNSLGRVLTDGIGQILLKGDNVCLIQSMS